jgi:hypothetical protein
VLGLVGCGRADEQEIRLVRLGDVLEHRQVGGRPVEPLVGVGLLARDARLENGEVGRRRGREPLGQELSEVAREARLAEARPRRGGAADGRVEQADAREIGGESSTLTRNPAVRPLSEPPRIVTLTPAHSPSARMPTETVRPVQTSKRPLRLNGRGDCRVRPPERCREPVATSREDRATGAFDDGSQDLVVHGERGPHLGGMPLPMPRRAFHVGEQEGDRSRRPLGHLRSIPLMPEPGFMVAARQRISTAGPPRVRLRPASHRLQ